jgi:hypothetical protein
MQLELHRLDAMRAAKSCHDLWMHATNDEYFDFRMYVRYVTGKDIPAYGAEEVADGGEPPEYWELAQPVVDVLEWSVDQVKLLLPDKPTTSDLKTLDDKLAQGEVPARSETDSKVLQHLVNDLIGYVSGTSPLDDGPIDHLIRVPPPGGFGRSGNQETTKPA